MLDRRRWLSIAIGVLFHADVFLLLMNVYLYQYLPDTEVQCLMIMNSAASVVILLLVLLVLMPEHEKLELSLNVDSCKLVR